MVKKLNISSQKNNQNVIESLKHTLHKKKRTNTSNGS